MEMLQRTESVALVATLNVSDLTFDICIIIIINYIYRNIEKDMCCNIEYYLQNQQ
jgi:hypothetical protein